MVDRYFSEVARVLKPGGDFVIFNFSYWNDDEADISAVHRLATKYSFDELTVGERPLALWDGLAFHLRKRLGRV